MCYTAAVPCIPTEGTHHHDAPSSPFDHRRRYLAGWHNTFFPVKAITTRAYLAVDGDGVHAAISAYADDAERYPVYYAYCPAGCAQAANWQWQAVGNLGTRDSGARLAVDLARRPRMMWF